jgi:fermentation-respiration switch protein FrsA (DUF1100 family)
MGTLTQLAWIVLCVLGATALLALLTAYICYRKVFYATNKDKAGDGEEYPIPDGDIYEAHRAEMGEWIKQARSLPHTCYAVRSHDGLTLRGHYYEHHAGAPIELLMHGYRGNAERDMSGAIDRCFALGHSTLIVDQRAAGKSDGHVITFGVNESRDCRAWVDLILREIDPDARIIIGGVSMGAATVMIAAGEELPPQVVGVLADCGYSTAKRIIKKVIAERGYPVELVYFFARLGGRIYGHFDVEERDPLSAMARCRLPIIFLHGDTDDFVPHSMSEECYAACASDKKQLVLIPGAGHGLAFPVDKTGYLQAVGDFFGI